MIRLGLHIDVIIKRFVVNNCPAHDYWEFYMVIATMRLKQRLGIKANRHLGAVK